ADGDGWNLLGNPFAGMLSVANIGSWSGTAGLQSTVGQMWQCVPDTSPTVECVGSYTTTTLAGNEIPVWQGVFYQATTAGTLEVPISARGTSQSRQQQPALLAFHLDVTDAASGVRRTDRAAVLVLDDDALPEQDALDAEKLSPLTYPYVALAFEGTSEEGPVLLAQDARPLTATEAFSIPLVLETAGLAGTATLTWPQQTLPDGWRVQLTDRVTGTTVDLAEADVYTFEVAGAARTSSQAISALSRMAEAGVSLRASDTPRFDLHVLPPTATAADPEEAPRELALAPPYPNPTTGALSLTYSLPSATSVRLAVYDLLGRTVAVLADGEQAAGTWQTTWDASTAAAGVYVVRFEAAGQVQTQKVTVTTR
ncbi:MAG: T9SS type A sorting domain-containing protein, partial [Bacteroidota bacterium]